MVKQKSPSPQKGYVEDDHFDLSTYGVSRKQKNSPIMKNTSKKMNRIAQTMTVAATLLDVDLSLVKLAKRSGAKAFLASGRVDLEKLKKWLAENPPGGTGADRNAGAQPPPVPVDLQLLESSLRAAISVEETNLQMLRAAQARNDAIATASLTDAFQKSQKNRLLAERDVRRQKVEAGALIDLDSHLMQLNKLQRPIVDCVRRIPRKVSLQLEGDSALIEKIVGEQVEAALAESKALCFPRSDDEKRWAARQLLKVVCGTDGKVNAETLEQVDSLRRFVVSELAKIPGQTAQAEL